MRAITIAIGKQGIDFFMQQYLQQTLTAKFRALPDNRSIYVGPGPQDGRQHDTDLSHWFGDYDHGAAKLTVSLTGGTLENFNPVYSDTSQGVGNAFTVNFAASNCGMKYQQWSESYYYQWRTPSFGDLPPGDEQYEQKNNVPCGPYTVNIARLKVAVNIAFDYDKATKVWELKSQPGSTAKLTPGRPSDTPPGWVRDASRCLSTHVSDEADAAIKSIDFPGLIASHINGVLATIPGSGDMGDGIKYDFSLAESPPVPMGFPAGGGVQIAVHGGLVTPTFTPPDGYKLPDLPLPAPPTDSDTHHVVMYVSNYEIDALYSACRQKGRLDLKVGPADLKGDAEILKTNHYMEIPAFAQYPHRDIEAKIVPNADPLTSFQEVWLFTKDAMKLLQSQLPPNVYQNVAGFDAAAYVSKSVLEKDLACVNIEPQYFETIEKATSRSGMVVKSDLNFKLVIQTFKDPLPYISFSVKRTDVFTDLDLKIGSGNRQLLTFSVTQAGYTAAFGDSNIPGFKWSVDFGQNFWGKVGEDGYDRVMRDVGASGAPLPIMRGFKFDFADAQLTVQLGFVSIRAKVAFT
jgi:hypothetical protein